MAENVGYQKSFNDQVDRRTERLCEPSKKKNKRTTAEVFCKNCNQYQCSECEKAHGTFGFMTGHELVDATQASTIPPASKIPELDLEGLDKCTMHGEFFKFFCVDHQTLCCSSCAILLHWTCNEVNGLTNQASKSRCNVSRLIHAMTEMKACASNVVDHVQKAKATTRTQIGDLPGKIDEMKNTFVRMFEMSVQNIREKVDTIQRQQTGDLDKRILTNKDIIQSLEKSLTILQNVVSQGSEVQIYIATDALLKQIEKYQFALGEQQDGLYTLSFSVEYTTLISLLPDAGDSLGWMNVDKTYIDKPSLKPIQLELVKSVDVKQTKGGTDPSYYDDLAFLSDGRLVVLHLSERLGTKTCILNIMNQKLKTLGTYKFKTDGTSVAVVSPTEVAVPCASGDGATIDILQVSKSNTITLIRTVKCSTFYYSICLMNDSTFLVSTLDEKPVIRTISMTGEESYFPGLPEEYISSGVATYVRNTVVISDPDRDAVYLYDVKDGKACTSRCVVKDERIKGPRRVFAGTNDDILVCSGDTNSIVQISLTGEVISSHILDMTEPFSGCVSPDGSILAVSNDFEKKPKLQIYKFCK